MASARERAHRRRVGCTDVDEAAVRADGQRVGAAQRPVLRGARAARAGADACAGGRRAARGAAPRWRGRAGQRHHAAFAGHVHAAAVRTDGDAPGRRPAPARRRGRPDRWPAHGAGRAGSRRRRAPRAARRRRRARSRCRVRAAAGRPTGAARAGVRRANGERGAWGSWSTRALGRGSGNANRISRSGRGGPAPPRGPIAYRCCVGAGRIRNRSARGDPRDGRWAARLRASRRRPG